MAPLRTPVGTPLMGTRRPAKRRKDGNDWARRRSSPLRIVSEDFEPAPAWRRKEDCPGCLTLRDELGRMKPGLCSPNCMMRRGR